MKLYHHNDLDGQCAAAIVYNLGPKDEFTYEIIQLDYKDDIPLNINEGENVYVVDFSFNSEVMEKILQKTDKVFWFDHHKTSMDFVYSKEIKGVRRLDLAACEIVWEYFGKDLSTNDAVRYIGDRDRWAWLYGNETAKFCEGMAIQDTNPKAKIWNDLLMKPNYENDSWVSWIKSVGEVCLQYRESFCKSYLRDFGFATKFDGYDAYSLNLYHFGSKTFGDKISKYSLCISFAYDGRKWSVGLYSEDKRTGIDVSEIARKYGGGGHPGAAGFVSETMPDFLKEHYGK